MIWSLLIGLTLAVVAVLGLLARARRKSDQIEGENQRLAQDRQRLLDFMHLMAEALGQGLSQQELQQRIVHASIICTGALSACFFERTDHGTMRGVAVEGLFPPHRPLPDEALGQPTSRAKFIEQVLKSEEFPVGEGIVGRVARTSRGELLADAAADPLIVKHADPSLAVHSVIAVPLVFRERFFGVLTVTNPTSDQPFTTLDFTLMQTLAEHAGLALHNSEFLHFQVEKTQLDLDLSVARTIQQMLLPRQSATISGLELDARYAPAQKIGGDLYDFFPLADARFGLAVADVSGKGIPAALLMAICRTNLRQIAPRMSGPADVLREMNRVLSPDIHAGYFVTMLYAVIDLAANTVTFARAGHELPLFVRRNQVDRTVRTDYAESEGMSLGLVGALDFASAIVERTVPFAVGDVLVLYTDGVTEAPNEDEKEFSGARLADAVRARFGQTSREINQGILDAVEQFAGESARRDDLTLVTVRRT